MRMRGRLTRVTLPAVEPITLAEAKAHLRVEHSDDDELINALILTVRQRVDGNDGVLGRVFIEQAWDYVIDRFPYCGETLLLPLPPLISVDEISYIDGDGDEQILSASVYQVIGAGAPESAEIAEAYGERWPTTRNVRAAVTIRFTCGYAPDAASPPNYRANVPAPIKQAMLLMVGDLYENRETVQVGSVASEIPFSLTVNALIKPYKETWF